MLLVIVLMLVVVVVVYRAMIVARLKVVAKVGKHFLIVTCRLECGVFTYQLVRIVQDVLL